MLRYIYGIDVLTSPGEGKPVATDIKTTIYKVCSRVCVRVLACVHVYTMHICVCVYACVCL